MFALRGFILVAQLFPAWIFLQISISTPRCPRTRLRLVFYPPPSGWVFVRLRLACVFDASSRTCCRFVELVRNNRINLARASLRSTRFNSEVGGGYPAVGYLPLTVSDFVTWVWLTSASYAQIGLKPSAASVDRDAASAAGSNKPLKHQQFTDVLFVRLCALGLVRFSHMAP